MKNKIKSVIASTVCLLLFKQNAFAYSVDFSSMEYTGLNNGDFCTRTVEEDLSYKCAGSGEIGFRVLYSILSGIMSDENNIYTLSANVLAESAADGGATAKIKASVTTPGGFVGKEAECDVNVGEWTPISLNFAPEKGSVFDTVSFSSSDENNGANVFYVKDVALEKLGERFELIKLIDMSSTFSGGGANGGLNENGVRIGYTACTNWWLPRQEPYACMLITAGAERVSGVNIREQLPEYTADDIGKAYKVSCKILPYSTKLAGTNLNVKFGISDVKNYIVEPKYYNEYDIEVLSAYSKEGYTTLEYTFVLTEELRACREIILYLENTAAETLDYTVDDISISVERDY